MAMEYTVVGAISGFWFVFGFIIPCFIPKGPNKGITQWCLILTAVCCWVFWLITYLAQMNPLQGPKLSQVIVYDMAREWRLFTQKMQDAFI